jgi:KipI family sensor histidine kinase inhibitor
MPRDPAPPETPQAPRIQPVVRPLADTALTVEFGRDIDPAINARVLALDARLQQGCEGVVETVPTYRSLLVHYDPTLIGFGPLRDRLLDLSSDLSENAVAGPIWRVPVVYGGEHGIDLEEVAKTHGITPDEVVRRHSAPVYRVYMTGFLPGFAYLGGLDPSIATPRRANPRLVTPAGTISIGGIQALVASLEAPSGWHLLGRTPVRNFMASRDPVFLIKPGDRVQFTAISPGDFGELERAAAAGEPVAEAVAEPEARP